MKLVLALVVLAGCGNSLCVDPCPDHAQECCAASETSLAVCAIVDVHETGCEGVPAVHCATKQGGAAPTQSMVCPSCDGVTTDNRPHLPEGDSAEDVARFYCP